MSSCSNLNQYFLSFSDEKVDLAFLVDGSERMTRQGFDNAKKFVRNVYRNFPISEDATHVALMIYGDALPDLIFNFIAHTDKEAIDSDLFHTRYPGYGSSLLGKGLKDIKTKIFDISARPGSHKVLVVLAASSSEDDVDTPSRELRDKGIIAFGIGIGSDVDRHQLRKVVSSPEKDHMVMINPDCFHCVLSRTVQNIRQG